MNRWSIGLGVGLLIGVAQAGPLRLSDVPAEARWWVHFDVDQFKQTAVGRTVLDLLRQPDTGPKLDAMKAVFNFDIRTDLESITACGAGRRSAVVVRGRFDEQRLVTLLKAGDGYQELMVEGRTLHSWIDEGKAKKKGPENARMYGAIHRSGAAVLSEQAETAAHVLRVLDGEAAAQPESAAVQSEFPAVVVGRMSADALPNQQTDNPVARGLTGAVAVIGERGTNIEARLEMTLKNPQAAVQIRQIVDGLRAAALLNSEKDPRAARLAEQLVVRAEGTTLELRLSLPAAEVTEAMRAEMAKKRAAAPAQP
ncbi:MAG: hypothetical protein N2652_01860 [Kiritimatiellae bacterium]|nr:hypothetical protein [Kiritimatiellia bacterium]